MSGEFGRYSGYSGYVDDIVTSLSNELINGDERSFQSTVMVGEFLQSVAGLLNVTAYHEASDHYPTAEEYRANMQKVALAAQQFIADITDDLIAQLAYRDGDLQ